jgi:hypothetical protein
VTGLKSAFLSAPRKVIAFISGAIQKDEVQLEEQAARPLQKAARVAPLERWYMSGSSCQVEKSV